MKKIVFVFAVLVSSFGFGQSSPIDYTDSLETYTFIDEALICELVFTLINEERVKAGLNKLEKDTSLYNIAQEHAEWISETSISVHSSHIKATNMGPEFHRRYNYAENIICQKTIQNFTHIRKARGYVAIWMNSPGHKANILDPDFKYIGVGFSRKDKLNTLDSPKEQNCVVTFASYKLKPYSAK
jgi:uncharacterized protein YkwD